MEAEEIGVDVVYNWDHFYPLFGDPDGKHFECWTMLGSWAEITSNVEIGALVTCNSYRNPDLLADMARTVDHISEGRLILGLGAGWFEKDYQEYGFDFGASPGARLAELESALPRIESRFVALNPTPTRKIPIMIGGGGETKTLRYTARHADIWHSFGKPDLIARKNGILNEWCEKEGTDAEAIERSVGIDPAKLELVGEYLEAGSTHFTVGLSGPDYDMGPVRELVAWRDTQNAE